MTLFLWENGADFQKESLTNGPFRNCSSLYTNSGLVDVIIKGTVVIQIIQFCSYIKVAQFLIPNIIMVSQKKISSVFYGFPALGPFLDVPSNEYIALPGLP